jgi:malate dehydrogenase (oxaloacetate-decarboxylating)
VKSPGLFLWYSAPKSFILGYYSFRDLLRVRLIYHFYILFIMSQESPDYGRLSVEAHAKSQGKVEIRSKMPLENAFDLSIAYTPGVAQPCLDIHDDVSKAYTYTCKGNMVAVVSDGSAVLGLGNIGPEAALPVMEGKAVLFKHFGNVDAVPVVLNTQDTEEIIAVVKAIAPTYGGINLEDISAPRCFEIERRLKEELPIPVMHDDQHGTAIVTLAGMINAMKVIGQELKDQRVVINGAGAAGVAILHLLMHAGVQDVIVCDSRGVLSIGRDHMNSEKDAIAEISNRSGIVGTLADAVRDSDVFIGVSQPGTLTGEMIATMKKDPIIFAMANPIPEIMPDEARAAGARIIATGRSDFPNQINNVLAFPGIFRGALDARATDLTRDMFVAAAEAIAACVTHPTEEEIVPSPFQPGVADKVAEAVKSAWLNNKK